MLSTYPGTTRSLAARRGRSYDKGRGIVAQALWVAVSALLVTRVWCPNRLRCAILRVFGATVGDGVLIRHDVSIHWPWKLTIGSNSWLGTGSQIYNIDEIVIESDVCVSQQAFLCTGSHDYRSPDFDYDNGPIVLRRGAWIGVRAVVLRGVTVGANAVVGAAALVTADVPDGALVLAPVGVVGRQWAE